MTDGRPENDIKHTYCKCINDYKTIFLRGLSILYMNIRSLRNKLSDLEVTLHLMKTEIDFLVITENWLHPDNQKFYNIQNYKPFFCSRTDKKGGGVAMYVREDIVTEKVFEESLEHNNIQLNAII